MLRIKSLPANEWTHPYMKSFGLDHAPRPLTFDEFFGIPSPDTFGDELPDYVRARVRDDVKTCMDLGALKSGTNARMSEISRAGASAIVMSLYKTIHHVANRYPTIESNVDILARYTMDVLGFTQIHPSVDVASTPPLRLTIAEVQRDVFPDLVLGISTSEAERRILLVQEDKSVARRGTVLHAALPQLVAGAIAAYKDNEQYELQSVGATVIYGVIMTGTLPTFYKIPIDDRILDLVESGTTTNTITTTIQWYNPLVSMDSDLTLLKAVAIAYSDDDFTKYLKCYEALRRMLSADVAQLNIG